MNKKTYGEGTRFERTDHEVVAATTAAKEKLREQLGEGEGVRIEQLSRIEFLEREELRAFNEWREAADVATAAYDRATVAMDEWQKAVDALDMAKAEEEKDG